MIGESEKRKSYMVDIAYFIVICRDFYMLFFKAVLYQMEIIESQLSKFN